MSVCADANKILHNGYEEKMRLTSGHIPTNAPSTRHSGL